jgi:RNA recognition motif-containing protein
MTIFVANFDSDTEEHDLKVPFENFGTVNDVHIASDWSTGERLDYAFVEMPIDAEAEQAIEKLNGRRWSGRRLKSERETGAAPRILSRKADSLFETKQVVYSALSLPLCLHEETAPGNLGKS